MLLRLLSSIHPRRQPWITRQSYSHELVTAFTFPVAMALIEGGVIGVLARKTFQAGPLLFATIMAAPMFANVTSFAWARLARCRRKVRFINVLQVAILAGIAAIALLPADPVGAVLLTALVVLCRCLLAGILTIRSTVWRMNYPRRVRGRVTSKLAVINSIIMTAAPVIGYALLDHDATAFRWFYPASIVIAMGGVAAFSRVRLRGERALLRYESDPAAQPQPHGTPASLYEYDPAAGRDNFWTVLKRDHLFRRYMKWQFCGGIATMMGDVVMIYFIVEVTRGKPHEYVTSVALSTAIPMLLVTCTVPLWARYFDRVHVARLRARQGLLWVLSQLLNWVGAWCSSLALLGIARVVLGVTRGAGMLAWTLGHNDFADRRLVALYMGIHVTLTGVRGAIGPFLAMMLYSGWSSDALAGLGLTMPAFDGIGHHVFLLCAALSAVATVGFTRLDRAIGRGQQK